MSASPSTTHRTPVRDPTAHARPPPPVAYAPHLRVPQSALSDPLTPMALPPAASFGLLALPDTPADAAYATTTTADDDDDAARWHLHHVRTEQRLLELLATATAPHPLPPQRHVQHGAAPATENAAPGPAAPAPDRKHTRIIDDDYGDGDSDDDDEAHDGDAAAAADDTRTSPLLAKSARHALAVPATAPHTPALLRMASRSAPTSDDDVRQQLQQAKQAAEDAARHSFHTLFYPLESDRDAMLEQQKLDELDRQVELETAGAPASIATTATAPQHGTLSTTNLGASSLTLKHLISRIDAQRDRVHATDAQLRSLISEVRKNRSKWANEDRVGQEELYESMEKVLMELKAGEHAHPFLQRVNKREAPDYYNVIKHPMDIGTMMKKLKQLQYKSKKDFVEDLMLIWSNCLKYNADPNHFLRKKALYMKKATEKLVPLIPDITVRDRAEVEAEERKLQRNGDGEGDGVDDSEDEEPIMASRGRKAPSKGGKGSSTARTAPPAGPVQTPDPEARPPVPSLNHPVSHLKNEFLRADSEMEGSVNGFATPPPPGCLTPLGINGIARNGVLHNGSQADLSEADGTAVSTSDTLEEEADHDDLEFKTWKQVTKKDRAIIASERHRLFRDDQLQADEPAILRTKSGMRRWLRHRKQAAEEEEAASGLASVPEGKEGTAAAAAAAATAGESLAEGIEGEEERQIPDYYDPVCAIPDLPEPLQWAEDAEGNAVQQVEEYMRILPTGQFMAPVSALSHRMNANIQSLQDTRKICAKIGIVKQMQLQSQLYQNQFQRYEPQPFMEADVEPTVVSEDGPVMAPYVCRAALQRSVGKIFYHAGFEEFQPSALDAVTDIAAKFFQNLVASLGIYRETPKTKSDVPITLPHGKTTNWVPRFNQEEAVLHTLHANGVDLESLETYVKDDVERLSSKLSGMHDRMRSYYAELLRPAMDNVGADGAGAFNDGSEQFVGGDFAEDIGEDFFGFKELGLDREFGLTFSVPLHLLQNRVHNAYARQDNNAVVTTGVLMPEPPKFEPVNVQTAEAQIGLVQRWLLAKLDENNSQPLIEDDDLPPKQRFPKPRLPPTGKISSPRKRPLREQQQLARKKRKLDEERDEGHAGAGAGGTEHGAAPAHGTVHANANAATSSFIKGIAKPIGKLKLAPSSQHRSGSVQEPEKEDGSSAHGMPSPPESF